GGMCVIPGTEDDCPEGSFTLGVDNLTTRVFRACVPPCETVADCRAGYRCQSNCQPQCTADDQCLTTGYCDADDDELCRAPEVCNAGVDNNLTAGADCIDASCVATCDQAFADQCAVAIPLPESGTFEVSPGQQSDWGGFGSEQQFFS